LNKNLCFDTILSEHASKSHSIDFGLFILLHQLSSSKLSYLKIDVLLFQTCYHVVAQILAELANYLLKLSYIIDRKWYPYFVNILKVLNVDFGSKFELGMKLNPT
jgi:hypothetical protein